MSRPLRIEYDGAWYHVMNRGFGGGDVFADEADGAAFLGLLGAVSERFGIEVHAYCLMPDHYHLLVHTPRGNLGRAMRHLNGVYTQAHNRRHGRDGPLFRGRYRAILVDAEAYLARLGRHIHRVPVAAAAVTRAEYYLWSSTRAYIGRAPAPSWLRTRATLDRFGGHRRRGRYRAYVAEADDELAAFYRQGRPGPVLGDAAFRDRVRARLGPAADRPEVADARRITAPPSLGRIARLTAAAFAVDEAELHVERRGRGARLGEASGLQSAEADFRSAKAGGARAGNLPRMVAMALARHPGGHPLADVAGFFGVGHYSSVTAAARRLDRRMRDDAALAATVAELRRRLANPPDDDRYPRPRAHGRGACSNA